MKKYQNVLLQLILLCLAGSCSPHQIVPAQTKTPVIPISSPTSVKRTQTCPPTLDDGVSPSYVPNAPERTVVGKGHVITGVVLSSADCQPIAQARLEFWTEEEGLGHPDSSRVTFFTDQDGRYRFECNMPDHIHMRISANGYRTIGVNSYHPNGQAEGTLDIVLQPE
jgi:protocatechuate 3,4-dioxygenase beta subunit